MRSVLITGTSTGIGQATAVVLASLAATTWKRRVTLPPTSDRIPGSAPARDLMHAHKWKRGAKETEATVKEIHRKAGQIAPSYNKGALQYLPGGKDNGRG